MANLKLSEEMAREIYSSSAPEFFKKILEENFTKEELTQDPEEIYDNALKLLRKEAKIMKGDFVVDWNNKNQKEWRAIFVWDGSGFVFTNTSYYGSYTLTGCGSRFHFPTSEMAEEHARKFSKEHNIVLSSQ